MSEDSRLRNSMPRAVCTRFNSQPACPAEGRPCAMAVPVPSFPDPGLRSHHACPSPAPPPPAWMPPARMPPGTLRLGPGKVASSPPEPVAEETTRPTTGKSSTCVPAGYRLCEPADRVGPRSLALIDLQPCVKRVQASSWRTNPAERAGLLS